MANLDEAGHRAKRLRLLAGLLDSKFKLGPVRFGLDPVLGLFPGVGDSVGAICSALIVCEAASLGVSKATISRMLANIMVDSIAGSMPFLGDVADVYWKANNKNVELVERELAAPGPRAAASKVWIAVVGMVLFLLVGLSIYLPIKVVMILINN